MFQRWSKKEILAIEGSEFNPALCANIYVCKSRGLRGVKDPDKRSLPYRDVA